jgi:hypothetical protein
LRWAASRLEELVALDGAAPADLSAAPGVFAVAAGVASGFESVEEQAARPKKNGRRTRQKITLRNLTITLPSLLIVLGHC